MLFNFTSVVDGTLRSAESQGRPITPLFLIRCATFLGKLQWSKLCLEAGAEAAAYGSHHAAASSRLGTMQRRCRRYLLLSQRQAPCAYLHGCVHAHLLRHRAHALIRLQPHAFQVRLHLRAQCHGYNVDDNTRHCAIAPLGCLIKRTAHDTANAWLHGLLHTATCTLNITEATMYMIHAALFPGCMPGCDEGC